MEALQGCQMHTYAAPSQHVVEMCEGLLGNNNLLWKLLMPGPRLITC